MSAAIRTSDLVVHHGGSGTSWTALSHGKPAVVVPLGGDQFRNADILSATGAVITCTPTRRSDLASAIATGLDEPTHSERAAAISRANAALPSVAELAHRISSLAETLNSGR